MRTFLARLAIAGAPEPFMDTPSDSAFEIYTAWLHHVLALVDQDKMQGYSTYLSNKTQEARLRFNSLSAEQQKDQVFEAMLNDKSGLLSFAEPLYANALDPKAVFTELTKYIRLTPDQSPV